jgi:hypothetical protein
MTFSFLHHDHLLFLALVGALKKNPETAQTERGKIAF